MTTLSFKCNEPFASFSDCFHAGGNVDTFRWQHRTFYGEREPDLSGFNISWVIESSQSVFEHYEECQLNLGKEISSRTPNFKTYWQNAKGVMQRYSADAIQITFAAPPVGFETFFMGIIVAGFGVEILTPSITFAEKEDAPSPSSRAFLENYEPAFFGNYEDASSNYPIFRPFRR